MALLSRDRAGLKGARAALAEPARRASGVGAALGCAFLLAAAAAGLCVAVLLGEAGPSASEGASAGVRAPLTR